MDVTIQAVVVSYAVGGLETRSLIFKYGAILFELIASAWIVIPNIIELIKNSIKVNAPNNIALTI